MNLVLLVFGDNENNHKQANFAILSFLAQKEFLDHIIIITDRPRYYTWINDPCIVVETVDKNVLTEWKGKYDFFWRIKIKAVEFVAQKWKNQSILYIDADTVLYGSLQTLKTKLDSGFNLMHLNEGKLSCLKTKKEKTMWKHCAGNIYSGIKIEPGHCMWNAGVVGIAARNVEKTIPLALQICDEMCADDVIRVLIEQFAFSLALNITGSLETAKSSICHYWGNKEEWNHYIHSFFIKNHFNDLSLQDEIDLIRELDVMQIPIFKGSSTSKRKILHLVDRIYTNKNNRVLYANSL